MGKLHDIGLKWETDKATLHEYLDFYEQHLPKKIGRLLEIGVSNGASVRMWHDYYPEAEIIGIDNGGPPLKFDGITNLFMDSKDVVALRELGKFDVIVDDGSHFSLDQQVAFEFLFDQQLNKGGVYIIEDLHCWHWQGYVNSKYSTIEYLKRRDDVIYYHRKDAELYSRTCLIKKP